MGMQRLMLALCDDRPWSRRFGSVRRVRRGLRRAMAEAGADMLSGGDSPAGLIGPRLYREVALPAEQRVIAALKSRLSLPFSLHICGNATPILADMAASGADVLELDHQVDMAAACRIVGRRTAMWGNLDPVGILARGGVEQVRAATDALLETMEAGGHRRFVLSSGCTLAVDTPRENIAAMLDRARRHGPLRPASAVARGAKA